VAVDLFALDGRHIAGKVAVEVGKNMLGHGRFSIRYFFV
jgi:hypothetical protein